MTVVGTRPEIIRLSRVIAKFDEVFDHTLVHTGQNWDRNLRDVFFEQMQIRRPDINLDIDVSSLGSSIADVITGTEEALREVKPDAFLVLGDTNSALSLIMARRMRVRSYHMEAGNRCFDERVPEEINRRLIDHTADFNLPYTESARRNLLAEGLHPRHILMTGSPMAEVIEHYKNAIDASTILDRLGVDRNGYFVASVHREETVDDPVRLAKLLHSLDTVAESWQLPVLFFAHPRTRRRMKEHSLFLKSERVVLNSPLGFLDYLCAQMNAKCVLSDSGTLSEESNILDFPSILLRSVTERPESLEAGRPLLADITPNQVADALNWAEVARSRGTIPWEYQITNCSDRVARFVMSTRDFT